MIVAAFSTNETYEKMARDLAASVEAFGYECMLFKCEDTGAWTRNVNHKPTVIKSALMAAAGDSVFYIDADARMVQKPTLIPSDEWDVAVYYDTPTRPCGGSMWFHSLERCGALVDDWIANVAAAPESADDWINFKAALDKHKPRILHLPPSYNYHKPTMRSRFPGAKPVIEHYCSGIHNYQVY